MIRFSGYLFFFTNLTPFFVFFDFFIQILAASTNPDLNFPCKPPSHLHPFCNTSLSIAARSESIISLLTLTEKIQQLSTTASPIPRLGIPAYEWWSEALHGIASNGPGVSFSGPQVHAATAFAQVILLAATFNRPLWRSIASAVGMEARAMHNVGQAGLTFWAPNVNIFRDPRWGRGQETPGEDPFLTSSYAVEFVKGFQRLDDTEIGEKRVLKDGGSKGEDGLMVSACCKHFIAYDLEKWGSFSRYRFDAVVSKQDLEDTYYPPFRSCIQKGRASCLMCSYNRLNGIPACARADILDNARREWDFNGYISSDCDAVATIYEDQKYVKTPEDAVSLVLKAGVDINCGTYLLRNSLSAIDQGKMVEKDIDRALGNLFSVQIRLGLFDGDPRKGRFGNLGATNICTSEHMRLALDAAEQGIVLLKNNGGFLPLKKNGVSSLAVIGPMAIAGKLGGGYSGVPCRQGTILDGLREYVEVTHYAAGCLDIPCVSDAGFDDAILVAKNADAVIIVGGLDLSQETEDRDRISLLLPGRQMELVSAVSSVTKNSSVVLVLTGGGPLDVSFAKNDPQISSILWIGYPGEAGGKALAEIIFGDINPGGRLPMTWYPQSFTNVPMNDMNMRPNPSRDYPGRTYKFYTGQPVYNFGHGVSYTDFTHAFISAPKILTLQTSPLDHGLPENIISKRGYVRIDELGSCDSLKFRVHLSVTNVGDRDGKHSVLLFVKVPGIFAGVPMKQLIGFDSAVVGANERREMIVEVDMCEQLSVADEDGIRVLGLGEHVLMLEGVQHSFYVQI